MPLIESFPAGFHVAHSRNSDPPGPAQTPMGHRQSGFTVKDPQSGWLRISLFAGKRNLATFRTPGSPRRPRQRAAHLRRPKRWQERPDNLVNIDVKNFSRFPDGRWR